jgi:Choline dehydrogenase and related flavoproteins
MMYTRAAASDFDDWEKLGNAGWGSKDLIPLLKKVRPLYS